MAMPPPRWSRRRARRWPRAWAPSPRRSCGPRAPPRPTIWRFSASPSYYRGRGRHIVTARTEHKAVLDPCRELERRGWRVTYLAPDGGGVIRSRPSRRGAASRTPCWCPSCTSTTRSASIQDIAAHRRYLRRAGRRGCMWMRRRASASAILISPRSASTSCRCRRTRCTARRASARCWCRAGGGAGAAHAAALRRRSGAGLALGHRGDPSGGGHGHGVRAGSVDGARAKRERIGASAGAAVAGVGVARRGTAQRRAARSVPHMLNVSFEGVEGESLLAAVGPDIAVSTGSACTSALQRALLRAARVGPRRRLSESSLRFGLGRYSSDRTSTRRWMP